MLGMFASLPLSQTRRRRLERAVMNISATVVHEIPKSGEPGRVPGWPRPELTCRKRACPPPLLFSIARRFRCVLTADAE